MTKEELQKVREALETAPPGANTGSVMEWSKWYANRTQALALIETALAQTEQEPVIGTKTWWVDGKLFTQCLYPSDVYKDAAPVAQKEPK